MAIYFYNQYYDVFNNFSPHMVEIEGVLYPTAEHAYQAAKCTDPAGKEAIRTARSPLLAKQLANETYNHARHPQWETIKLQVMETVLRAKYNQHQEVRDALAQSGTEVIHEDSPTDSFWGCGAQRDGQSHLGKLWMKIRATPPGSG